MKRVERRSIVTGVGVSELNVVMDKVGRLALGPTLPSRRQKIAMQRPKVFEYRNICFPANKQEPRPAALRLHALSHSVRFHPAARNPE
jgi:hypothetical protein